MTAAAPPTAKFRYAGSASIKHLNTRKEGPEEDKELACDVKLVADTTADALAFFDVALADFLYTPTGAVRSPMLEPLQYMHWLEHYRLEALGRTFYGVSVKKFSIAPRDGRLVSLGFSLSFKPSSNELALFAECLQDDLHLKLEPENEELPLGDAK